MVGRTAYERDLRGRLSHYDGVEDDRHLTVPLGVLRGILHDLDLWHEIVENEVDKWSFDALVAMAKRLLSEVYPDKIFPMPAAVLEAEVFMRGRDSGPVFVSLLRKVIEEMEREPKQQ